jgi:ATP-dependent exoDNAse (exonuclease V) beta subunit
MRPEAHAPVDAPVRAEVIEPGRSYIVQAPAGSGKTELLTQRFLRLLAVVDRPQKVLAITFTRKATHEMLERILGCLRGAATGRAPDEPHKQVSHELALAVLERDRVAGWDLLQNPGQLQIHTIDGLCARIAARGSGVPLALGGLAVVEHPRPHYAEAARQTIEVAAGEPSGTPVRVALEELLFRERGNANRIQELLARELPRRDQWLDDMVSGPRSQAMLLEARQLRELEVLQDALGATQLQAARAAVLQLAQLGDDPAAARDLQAASERCAAAPGGGRATASETELTWRVLSCLATAKHAPYTPGYINRSVFPGKSPERNEPVARLKEIVELWRDSGDAAKAFERFVKTPPLDLGPDNDRLVDALRRLLVTSCAQLNVQFASHGVCDFQHVAQQALGALGDEQAPGEALLIEDGRLEHILVDEFQDTSQLQYALVERLVEGWEPDDGRSLFLVGDPMQSIYAFRKADVTLFDRVVGQGFLGNVALEYRQLQVNFRSREAVINHVNTSCRQLFKPPSPASPGFVGYTPVAAFHGAGGTVTLNASLKTPDGAGEREEAARIADRIMQLQARDPNLTVGILTRKRKQLEPVARALQARQLDFEAVEVESLKTRPVIQDLLTITRALVHPGDRIAWLGVLLAPWCALQPAELLLVAGPENRADLLRRCQDRDTLAALDAASAERVRRVAAAMEAGRSAAVRAPLAERVESCWISLGGPRVARRAEDLQDADVFLQLLDQVAADQPDDLLEMLNDRLDRLYAGSHNAPVQLMTIHKAKGLEFDAVFLPGLQGAPARDQGGLFRHRDIPMDTGTNGSLLAPTKPSGSQLPSLFDYLGLLETEAQACEAQRLLYVAMTRARRYLELSAVVEFKKDGGVARAGGTFLDMLLDDFGPALAGLDAAVTDSPEDAPALPVPLVQLRDAEPELCATPFRAEPVSLGEPPPDRARLALGEALHHWLELIHNHWGGHWLEDWFETHQAALRSSLLLAGAPREQAAGLQEELVALLSRLLADPLMREQLSPDGKRRSYAEAEYLVADRGRIRQFIIDRLYQDQAGRWHVIDYKTGLDQSLTREKWARQLDSYARLVQEAEGGDIAEALILQAGSAQLIDPAT